MMREILRPELEQLIRAREPFEIDAIRGVVRDDPRVRSYYVVFKSERSVFAICAVCTNGEWFTLTEAEAARSYGTHMAYTYKRWRMICDCVSDAREVSNYKTLIDLAFYGLEEAIRRMVSCEM